MQHKSVLGKGLSALIADGGSSIRTEQIAYISVDEICLNPTQPRKHIDDEKILELSESIKAHGLLQPVIVTRKDGLYHLVVGERRLRASRMAGMATVPAIVKEYAWDEMLKVALVENIQRQDLNPVEEARAYRMLLEDYGLKNEQVAEAIGRSRPYVANMVRLLNLPVEVIEDLEGGELTAGHARALLGLNDERQIIALWVKIKKEGLSVRQVESIVKRMKEEKKSPACRTELPPAYRKVQDELSSRLSARVSIVNNKGNKGRIEIFFSSREELGRLVSCLGGDEEWL